MTRFLGLFCALAAASIYAVTVNLIPFAQALGGSALFYLAMRAICNFGLSFLPSPNLGGIAAFSKQPVLLLLLGSLVALQGYGYIQALHLIPISIATPLFFLFPVMTYLLQKLLQREAMHAIPLLALCSASLGVWLLAQSENETGTHLIGIFWALIGALAQTLVNCILVRFSELNPWQMLRACYLPSFILFVGYALTQPLPGLGAIAWTLASAIMFCLSSVLFLQAIKLLGAIRTSNVMYFEPAFAVILSLSLHDDTLPTSKTLAIALIFGATLALEGYEYRIRQRRLRQQEAQLSR